MRIIAYSVSSDELPFFEKYAHELGVAYKVTSKPLNEETMHLAKGCQGVSDFMHGDYTNKLLQQLQDYGIKYLSLRSVGYDGINLDLFKQHHIKLANVPQYSPNAIAEFTIALTLMLLRNLQVILPRVKTQDYARNNMKGRELADLTVGVVGTGHIGARAAKLFAGFGAKVVAYDHQQSGDLTYVDSLEDLYRQADVVSLHVPLTDDNHYMINTQTISQMKDSALLINTARGGLVDSKALLRALTSKKLAGAGLDVYEFFASEIFGEGKENEVIDDPTFLELSSLPNVIITPHIAYNTVTAIANMVKISTQNLLDFDKTGQSTNQVA